MQRIGGGAADEGLRRGCAPAGSGQRPPVQMMRPRDLRDGQGDGSTQAALDRGQCRVVPAAGQQRVADRQPAAGEILVPFQRRQQRQRFRIATPQQQGGQGEERLRLLRRRRVRQACGVQRRVVAGGSGRPSDRGRP